MFPVEMFFVFFGFSPNPAVRFIISKNLAELIMPGEYLGVPVKFVLMLHPSFFRIPNGSLGLRWSMACCCSAISNSIDIFDIGF
jgi:hypothetical protein